MSLKVYDNSRTARISGELQPSIQITSMSASVSRPPTQPQAASHPSSLNNIHPIPWVGDRSGPVKLRFARLALLIAGCIEVVGGAAGCIGVASGILMKPSCSRSMKELCFVGGTVIFRKDGRLCMCSKCFAIVVDNN